MAAVETSKGPGPERLQFKQLLAANPDHFAKTLKAPAHGAPPVGNTNYEELTCLGYNPALKLLEATVQVKLPGGFLTSLCGDGSTEYVRFYIDYGSGWEEVGISAFNAHDIANTTDCANHADKPLVYVVTHPLEPKPKICWTPVLPKVRAILSWQVVPSGPTDPVVWGNGVDRHIQIIPKPWLLKDIVQVLGTVNNAKLALPQPLLYAEKHPIPLPDPPDPTFAQQASLYHPARASVGTPAVEPHRFGFAEIQRALTPGLLGQPVQGAKIEAWKSLGLDWEQAVGDLFKTSGDTSYEQLDCLGLDYNLERLVATFRIKRPIGYAGPPCSHGSREYVAFWADWEDACHYTYLGTAEITVHDYEHIPADGLHYAAVLKVNLDAVRRQCHEPRIGRVRAVLSWNQPPSTTDPNALPHWGNRVDAHIQVRPGAAGTGPLISIIGGVGVAQINTTTDGLTAPGAQFALTGGMADPWDSTRSCPFGGQIVIQGPPLTGQRYRVVARRVGSSAEVRVTDRIWTVNQFGVGTWRYPDIQDAFTYLSDLDNLDDVLASWVPSGNDLWEVQLRLVNAAGHETSWTAWHRIQLDNTAPIAGLTIDGGDCDEHTPGAAAPISGRFVAQDNHFGAFSLVILPASLWPPYGTNPTSAYPTTPTPPTQQTAPAPGDSWNVNTAGMKPCGYVVKVHVWDRTIVNSGAGMHNYATWDAGFCLLKKV